MADSYPASKAVFIRQLAHQVNVHLLRRIAGVQMHVDVHIELTRQLEDPMDLPGMVGIIIRCGADDTCAAPQTFDQQSVSAWIVGQPLLREDADLDVDRPGIVVAQSLNRFEAAHLHAAIELQMRAHSRGAMLDALLQRAAGALINVLDSECLLHRGDALHGIGLRALARAGSGR